MKSLSSVRFDQSDSLVWFGFGLSNSLGLVRFSERYGFYFGSFGSGSVRFPSLHSTIYFDSTGSANGLFPNYAAAVYETMQQPRWSLSSLNTSCLYCCYCSLYTVNSKVNGSSSLV